MTDKNRIFSFVIVIVVLLAGLLLYARPGSKVNSQDSISTSGNFHLARKGDVLTTEEKLYDFGTISMKNGNVSKVFKITNAGSGEVEISKLTTSCMCTTAYLIRPDGTRKGPFGMPGHGSSVPRLNETIRAGESRDIEVVYDPNAHGPAGVGMVDRFVFLEDSNGEVLQLEIKANVTP